MSGAGPPVRAAGAAAATSAGAPAFRTATRSGYLLPSLAPRSTIPRSLSGPETTPYELLPLRTKLTTFIGLLPFRGWGRLFGGQTLRPALWPCKLPAGARKSVVEGKRVAVRVDPGGRRSIKKKKKTNRQQ